MPYSLRTLGAVSLLAADATATGRATQRRRLALLVLLAAAGREGLTRDKLIAYLWPERSTERCRHALSQALHAIRRQLGPDAIIAGVDDLRLNPEVVTSDIAELETAWAAGDARRVVELYRGPFLDGFFVSGAPEFERWADAQRSRLERLYAEALDRLAAEAVEANDLVGCVEAWRLRAALDPLDSAVALSLMEALVAAGDRPGAIRHAEQHALAVRHALETAPDPAVSALVTRLRTEAEREPTAQTATTSPSPPARHETLAPDAASPRTSPPARPDGGFRPYLRPVALAGLMGLMVLLVLAAGSIVWRRGTGEASAPRPVVVAAVRGSDAVLSLAVQEALLAELISSPEVRVVPPSRVRATIPLMRLPADAVVTTEVGKDVALRLGVPAVVAASVEPLGTGAQLSAQLIDAANGEILAHVSRSPRTQDEIVGAVASLATELRQRIAGTPLDPAPAMPAVSTTSLPALKSYAQARQALVRIDRRSAIEHAEVALVHDSLFAMAHYLLGDLYWYVDSNRRAQEHLRRAQHLSDGLHARERLVVRARYEELVEDRPDSALVYWRLLTRSHPDEASGWEGKRWVYRALAQQGAMAAAAESAYVRDPDLLAYFIEDRIRVRAPSADTLSLFEFADSFTDRGPSYVVFARFQWAMHRGEWSVIADSRTANPYFTHMAHLGLGRLEDARQALETLRGRAPWMQELPRALLLQARAEATKQGGSVADAGVLAREALDWVRAADLSPPAYARLAERIADVGVRIGDAALVREARELLIDQDAGRGLRSYAAALMAMDAFDAMLNGEHARAARLAAETRRVIYYGRSIAILVLLEADALAAAGNAEEAEALYRLILQPGALRDGDEQTLAVLRAQTARIGRRSRRVRGVGAAAGRFR